MNDPYESEEELSKSKVNQKKMLYIMLINLTNDQQYSFSR